jgi:hypothetical protein
MLALQHQQGTQLDTAATALRTACLTGIAQHHMASKVTLPSGNSLVLTAGDLDEAVAGLLNNGLAASDVNGNTVAAGFTRIMAYRSGLINPDIDACYQRFPQPRLHTFTPRHGECAVEHVKIGALSPISHRLTSVAIDVLCARLIRRRQEGAAM